MPLQNDEEFIERIYFDEQLIRWAYLDDELVYGLFDIKFASPAMPSSYPKHFVWGQGTSLPDSGQMNSLGYDGDGYPVNHFSGWYAENDFITKIENISKDMKADSILYAKWQRRRFFFRRTVTGTIPGLKIHTSLNDLPREFYTLASYGGLATASGLGAKKPDGSYIWDGAIVPDCQGYCYGRWLELGASNAQCQAVGLQNSASWTVRKQLYTGGADSLPSVGSVLLFTDVMPGAPDGTVANFNHQAFVEKIENGVMTISQSNYDNPWAGDRAFNTTTIGYSVAQIDAWGRSNSAGPYKGYIAFPGTLPGTSQTLTGGAYSNDPNYVVDIDTSELSSIKSDKTVVTTEESTARYKDDLSHGSDDWTAWQQISSGSSANTSWSD